MPAVALAKSANGNLDLKEAFNFTKQQIITFVQAVADDPKGHGVEHQVTVDNEDYNVEEAVDWIVDNIVSLAEDKVALDVTLHKDGKVAETYFDGFLLPSEATVFDCLGWILSITAKPDVPEVTEANFFLPLAAVFHKWCMIIIPKAKAPAMTHISYWNDCIDGKLYTLLGATPGASAELHNFDDQAFKKLKLAQNEAKKEKKANPDANITIPKIDKSARSFIVIRNRQECLQVNDMVANDPAAQNVKVDGSEQDIGYGRCAETMFYIWASSYVAYHDADRKPGHSTQPEVRGFALEPQRSNHGAAYEPAAKYVEAAIKKTIVPPCTASCKNIMIKQMTDKWDWTPDFDPTKVPRPDKVKVVDSSKIMK